MIESFSGDTIIGELAGVYDSIDPGEFALATEETIEEVTLVGISVFESDFTWAVETFSVDFTVLGRSGDLALPGLVEDFG